MGDRAELVDYLQRAIGYTLTGSTREQVFFLLYGTGRNGKSVFMNTIAAMMGDYASETPTETLMVKPLGAGGASSDVACLAGARLVGANESEDGQRLAEARIKALTGGDPITARHLYQAPFTFTPAFKLWLRTNHRPDVKGTDEGIWRRVRLVPFAVTIPESDVDHDLSEKLAAELPGILAWAVRGCLAWQAGGLGYPDAIRRAVEGYRDEMDHIGPFLDQLQVKRPIRAEHLHEAYKTWCAANDQEPMNATAFGKRLNERGWGKQRKTDGVYRVPPADAIAHSVTHGQPGQGAFIRAGEAIEPAADTATAPALVTLPAVPAPAGVTIVREAAAGIWAPPLPAGVDAVTLPDGSRAVEV
jgi:putative DNA primase/helicase